MQGLKRRGQTELVCAGSIEDFIPKDHVLYRVNRVLDLSWLRDEVSDCYSLAHGRPSIDPEVAVRLMLAGMLLGIVHDRKLMREAQVHLAIRWFAGFGLTDRLPDHSSLTRIRQRWGMGRFQKIFERSVEACVEAGLVGGDLLHVDATLVRADVSWSSLARVYVSAVDANNEPATVEESDSNGPDEPEGKLRKISRTDPSARMATNKYNQRMEPCFKQLTAVDSKIGVCVDATVISADRHEGQTFIEQVDRITDLCGFNFAAVTADRAYGSAGNIAAMEERSMGTVISQQKVRPAKVPISRFKYDEKHDLVRCPKGRHLRPGSKAKNGRFFRAKIADCRKCSLRRACLPLSGQARSITIQDGYVAQLRARRRYLKKLPQDRAAYNAHRFRVEGLHGEAKACHGLNRAVRRGIANMAIQAWLTAAAINLKRLATAYFVLIVAIYRQIEPRRAFRGTEIFTMGMAFQIMISRPIMPYSGT